MKKVIFGITLISFVFAACKKDDGPGDTPSYTCATCKSTPDALAANNASNRGIYKGVFIGSTGTIMFNLANSGTTITAVLVIDGVTVNLTSNVTIVNGQPYNAPFTGTFNGLPVTINFAVGLSGGTPTVTSANIPGHPSASFTVIKETSSTLVEAFEGTYSTTLPETGNFNILILRSQGVWGGIARKTGGTSADDDDVNGTFTDNKLYQGAANQLIGTLNVDQLTGSFRDAGNRTITITGRRTL